ncbi:unnamed protein product, partial [Prorocentrum cordatum]
PSSPRPGAPSGLLAWGRRRRAGVPRAPRARPRAAEEAYRHPCDWEVWRDRPARAAGAAGQVRGGCRRRGAQLGGGRGDRGQRARCHRPLVARGRGHFEPEDAARSAAQRELERQYMVAVGWSAERVAECRRAFEQFDESMGDVLTESELLKPRRARGRYAPLVRDLDVAFLALSLDTSVEVRVDFLTFMRIMKMLDESEARRGMAGMLGFGDESSDRIIGIYQKLSDQHGFSAAGLPRSVVEQAMLSLLVTELAQLCFDIRSTCRAHGCGGSEPATVDFGGLLRFMKALQGMLGGESFEECLEDLLLGVGTVLSDQRERTKQVSTPKAAAPPRRGAAPPAAEPSAPQ